MRVRSAAAPRAAFSLMEVLVVMAILVVLAGAGGVIYMRYLEDAKKDRARIDVKMLSDAINSYKVQHGDYPPTLEALTVRPADGSTAYVELTALIDPWNQPYVFDREHRHEQTGKPHIYSLGPNPGDPNGRISSWSSPSGLGNVH